MTATDTAMLAARRRAVTGGGIGNFVEWFDFGLYGYFATTIAARFFPSEDPAAGLLSTFAVFGVGFLIRPIGSIVFGHLGDRIGRRTTLMITVVLMSVSTLAIGVLPGYATLGVGAPVLLTVCRLLQGFSAGGEYAGSNTFVIEYAAPTRRGRIASTMPAWTAAGTIGAAAISAASGHLFTQEWAWRSPFFLAAPLGLIGLYLRLRIDDSPVFRAVQAAGTVERAPIMEALRTAKTPMLVLFGFALTNAIGFYLLASYLTSYITATLHRSTMVALSSSIIALVAFGCSALIAGRLSDRYGRVKVGATACAALAILAIPAFALMPTAALLGQALLGLCLGPVSCTTSLLIVELFPARIRYSAGGLSYNLAYTAFGGTAAYMATWLVGSTGSTLAPAIYLAGAAVISAVTITLGRAYLPTPQHDPITIAPAPGHA